MAYTYKEGWAQYGIEPSQFTRQIRPCPTSVREVVYDRRIPRAERIELFLAHTETPIETRLKFWAWCIRHTPLGDGKTTGDILNQDFADALLYIENGDNVPQVYLARMRDFFEETRQPVWGLEDSMDKICDNPKNKESWLSPSHILTFFDLHHENLLSQIERLYLAHIKILIS